MTIAVNPVRMRAHCEVAVIGAGPYGLAAAAHLRATKVATRVFGEPMAFWRRNMPVGMKLRSPWVATHIADPRGDSLLDDYFREAGLRRAPLLPVQTFVDYGCWFQQRVAPDIDSRAVVGVSAADGGFRLALNDGNDFFARRVIVATGLLGHEYRPAQFDGLPRDLVSHSCEHTDSQRYRGRRVAVIGRGQSACESAALLHEAGAEVELICRGQLVWNADPVKRSSLRKAVRSLIGNALIPPSQVGPFPFNWLVEAPGIIHHFPQAQRDRLNEHCLRATAILWLRDRLKHVPVNGGREIVGARREGETIALTLDNGTRHFDHVLLATGYHIDVAKIGMLDAALRRRIARHDGSPVLSAAFESNVPGLHFVGASAVTSFGPLLRFIAGAGFAARRVTKAALAGGAAMAADDGLAALRETAEVSLAPGREPS
jgi:hypothetical protein